MKTFEPILPAPSRDLFAFDLTAEIQANVVPGSSTPPVISAVNWTCDLAVDSQVVDPTPSARLIGPAIYDDYKTAHLAGDGIDGATYVLTATVAINDGRVLVEQGELACLLSRASAIVVEAGAVPFDYDAFITQFPAFAGTGIGTLEALWVEAGMLFRNDASSPEQDLSRRRVLLNLLTAHLAQTYGGAGGTGGGGLVGRINSKSVNGVSVSAEGFGVTGSQAWYLTTRYGTDFWRLTAPYRQFRYVPGPSRFPVAPYRWPYSLT